MTVLTPEMMVYGYSRGLFPMAEPDEDQQIYWWLPERRGVLPLEGFHVPRRLARTIRKGIFDIRVDADFEGVITACASRGDTWLSQAIIDVFMEMHRSGVAHCVSAYRDNHLVGGVYGMALGRAFFAESMFHHETDASKVALVALVEWLKQRGCQLLDIQFITDHLRQFGAFEVDAAEYEVRLGMALDG